MSDDGNSLQNLILASLKRIEQDVRELRSELSGFNSRLQKLELELAVFKAKAATYGGIAGVIGGAVVTAIVQNLAR